MTNFEQQQRRAIVALGARLYQRGLIVAGEGNISIRLDEKRILATPSGLCKGELAATDLVVIDPEGRRLEGELAPSSEIKMHLVCYRERPEIRAVIHAHPPTCLSLMLAGYGLDRPILAESVVLLGKVPTAPFALPSTREVPESILPFIRQTDAVLLDRHGSLTLGTSLTAALFLLETLEQVARVYYGALQVGTVADLPEAAIRQLTALRRERYGLSGPFIPF